MPISALVTFPNQRRSPKKSDGTATSCLVDVSDGNLLIKLAGSDRNNSRTYELNKYRLIKAASGTQVNVIGTGDLGKAATGFQKQQKNVTANLQCRILCWCCEDASRLVGSAPSGSIQYIVGSERFQVRGTLIDNSKSQPIILTGTDTCYVVDFSHSGAVSLFLWHSPSLHCVVLKQSPASAANSSGPGCSVSLWIQIELGCKTWTFKLNCTNDNVGDIIRSMHAIPDMGQKRIPSSDAASNVWKEETLVHALWQIKNGVSPTLATPSIENSTIVRPANGMIADQSLGSIARALGISSVERRGSQDTHQLSGNIIDHSPLAAGALEWLYEVVSAHFDVSDVSRQWLALLRSKVPSSPSVRLPSSLFSAHSASMSEGASSVDTSDMISLSQQKQLKQTQKVVNLIQELLDTESTYVGFLNLTESLYITPLSELAKPVTSRGTEGSRKANSAQLMSQVEIDKVFQSWILLRMQHQKFESSAQKAWDKAAKTLEDFSFTDDGKVNWSAGLGQNLNYSSAARTHSSSIDHNLVQAEAGGVINEASSEPGESDSPVSNMTNSSPASPVSNSNGGNDGEYKASENERRLQSRVSTKLSESVSTKPDSTLNTTASISGEAGSSAGPDPEPWGFRRENEDTNSTSQGLMAHHDEGCRNPENEQRDSALIGAVQSHILGSDDSPSSQALVSSPSEGDAAGAEESMPTANTAADASLRVDEQVETDDAHSPALRASSSQEGTTAGAEDSMSTANTNDSNLEVDEQAETGGVNSPALRASSSHEGTAAGAEDFMSTANTAADSSLGVDEQAETGGVRSPALRASSSHEGDVTCAEESEHDVLHSNSPTTCHPSPENVESSSDFVTPSRAESSDTSLLARTTPGRPSFAADPDAISKLSRTFSATITKLSPALSTSANLSASRRPSTPGTPAIQAALTETVENANSIPLPLAVAHIIVDLFYMIRGLKGAYQRYASNFEMASATLHDALLNNPGLEQYCKSQQSHRDGNGQSIHSLLIMPIQRPLRYRMLLESLVAAIDAGDLKDAVQAILDQMKQIMTSINDTTREHKQLQELRSIALRLGIANGSRTLPFSLVAPGRYFKRDGPLVKYRPYKLFPMASHKQSRHVYLFNDLVLYGLRRLGGFEIRGHFRIDQTTVVHADDIGDKAMFAVSAGGKGYTFRAPDAQVCEAWVRDIRSVTSATTESRRGSIAGSKRSDSRNSGNDTALQSLRYRSRSQSISVARPPSTADRRLRFVLEGKPISKFSRKTGTLHSRFMYVTEDRLSLVWSKNVGNKGRQKYTTKIDFSSVIALKYGRVSSMVFRHAKRAVPDWLCFSVLTSQRSYDFAANTLHDVICWYLGLQILLQAQEGAKTASETELLEGFVTMLGVEEVLFEE